MTQLIRTNDEVCKVVHSCCKDKGYNLNELSIRLGAVDEIIHHGESMAHMAELIVQDLPDYKKLRDNQEANLKRYVRKELLEILDVMDIKLKINKLVDVREPDNEQI